MTKKEEKVGHSTKHKVLRPKKNGYNTLYLTIISVFVVIISAFALIIGLTIKISIDDLSYSATLDSLVKIEGFNKAIQEGNWDSLMEEINPKIDYPQRFAYYVITQRAGENDKGIPLYKVVAKSLELKNEKSNDWYQYTNPTNVNSFKLDADKVVYKADKYGNMPLPYDMVKVFTITQDRNNIHLGIPIRNSEFEIVQQSIWQGIYILVSIMLLVAIFSSFVLAQTIIKPLLNMEKTISKIAKGDLSDRLELTQYDELNKLVNAYNMMANALQRLYSTLEAKVNDRTRELKGAYAELQNTQAMMVHSEKMKSLGELVAGIMHEINNPINFIYGNMTHLNNYSNDLISIVDEYSKYTDSLKPAEKEAVENLKKEIDYGFLKSDLPELIKSCKEGADRAKNIIQDLKTFSRMDEAAITYVYVPQEIDTALNILHNKIKNKAKIHKEYIENVPKVEGFGGQLNQVFMNILDNAVGAIEKQGDIWIRINCDEKNENLIIEIEDNGVGMDSETESKVFDPFFTTKPVGQGTGLGMSITHKIIKGHQGNITVNSRKGFGTKFVITLPRYIDRDNLKIASLNEGENNGKI